MNPSILEKIYVSKTPRELILYWGFAEAQAQDALLRGCWGILDHPMHLRKQPLQVAVSIRGKGSLGFPYFPFSSTVTSLYISWP